MKFLLAIAALFAVSCASAPKTVNLAEVATTPKALLGGDYDALEEQEKIAVPTFKMAFAIQSDVSAKASGGYVMGGGSISGASVAMTTHLTGVQLAEMQAITDAAYAKFIDDLKKTGREVISFEAIKSHASFKDLELAKTEEGKPYVATMFGRTYVMFTPKGMPLFFRAGEPLTDQTFGFGNTKVLGAISYDLKAVTVVPTISIDFANTTSSKSGSSYIGSTSVEVDTTPELSVLGGMSTQLSIVARNSWIASAMLPGTATLKPEKILISSDYGQVSEVSLTDNKDLAKSLSMVFGAGAVTNATKSIRQINVSGANYKNLVTPAISKVTEAFANVIAETK